MRIALLLLALTLPLSAQSRAWRISVCVHVAGTVADSASSWGYGEANPLLASRDGRFGARAISIKAGISAAVIGAQWLILRRHPPRVTERSVIASNYALGAAWGAVAARNLAVRSR